MRSQIFIALLLVGFGCQHNPISINIKPPTLTVEDVNCTEVWLKISSSCANYDVVTLKRDTTILDTIRLTTADTTILDANLLPSHTYTYTLAMAGVKSVTAQARTMDTTSHAFTWTMYTLGDGTTSELNDVAIINDTLAYAVGKIHSGGMVYNLARWNGQAWNLQQLPYQGYPPEVHSVFAISDTDVWFDPWFHWNGQSFQELPSDPIFYAIGINKMWGNSNGLYVVGNNGFIAYYNGTAWTQISSGTSLDIKDIYGAQNANTGTWEIYAAAGNPLVSNDRAILQINGTTAQAISVNGINWALMSIWFMPSEQYWAVGDGMYEKHPTLSTTSWARKYPTIYTTYKIRGNDINDVFVCGAFGEILHYSGTSWQSYISQTYLATGNLASIAVRSNIVITVKSNNSIGVAIVGRC